MGANGVPRTAAVFETKAKLQKMNGEVRNEIPK